MDRDWSGVELRHLTALAAVARARSFRGAADDLGYVQSAVSQQIARLETVVGMRLVERTRGRAEVALTAAGAALLEHADAIAARMRRAKADLDRFVESSMGVVRIGACESAATRILPEMFAALGPRAGRLLVSMCEPCGSEEAWRLLHAGELDFAIDYLPLDVERFEHAGLMTMPCMLLVRSDSPLAERAAPPTLSELAELPLIEHPNWSYSNHLHAILEATGRQPRYSGRSNLNGAVQSLVAAGVGAAVLPRLAVDAGRDDVAAIDLTTVLPPARLVALWPRDRPPRGLQELVGAVRTVCRRLEAADGPAVGAAA